MAHIDEILAADSGLWERAKVDVFLCDGVPGCHLTKIGKEPPAKVIETDARIRCGSCLDIGTRTFAPLGLNVLKLGDFLTDEDRAEAERVAAQADIAGPTSSMLSRGMAAVGGWLRR